MKWNQDFLCWDGILNAAGGTELYSHITAAYLAVFNLEMFLCE